MADVITTPLKLTLMEFDSNNNNWGDVANTNFQTLEKALSSQGSGIAVTSADVTLSDAENAQAFLRFTGALTGNRAVVVRSAEKWWIARNECTGNFSLTLKTSGQVGGVVLRRGETKILKCDGSDVSEWKPHAQAVASGELEWCGTAGGSANALTLTTPGTHYGLVDGQKIAFRAAADNTGAVTVTITPTGYSALSAVDLVDAAGGALAAGAIKNGGIYYAIYSTGTGDLHLVGSTSAKVINSGLADMAQATIKGRASGAGTGSPQDLTGTQVTAILDTFAQDLKGLVPGPTAAQITAKRVLRADGWGSLPYVEYDMGTLQFNTTYSQAHGLGAAPAIFEAYLKWAGTEGQNPIGGATGLLDIRSAGDAGQPSLWKNATSVNMRVGNDIQFNFNSSGPSPLTPSQWSVVFWVFP